MFSHRLLSTEDGTSQEAPWAGYATPVLATDDLVIACTRLTITCSAWDVDDTTLTQRWTQELAQGESPVFDENAVVGGPGTGYALVRTGSTKTDGRVLFVSLADGTVSGSQEWKGTGDPQKKVYLAAADGWLSLDSSGKARGLSPDGTETDSSFKQNHKYTVLLADGAAPTVDQYRLALESGDVSWASTAFSCDRNKNSCQLNGTDITLPSGFRITDLGNGVDQSSLTAWTGDRYVLVGQAEPVAQDKVYVIDTKERRMVVEGPGFSAVGAKATVVASDRIVMIDSLVGMYDGKPGVAMYQPKS